MVTYLDLASLGPTEREATLRCEQMGIGGLLLPTGWRYQLLHQAGDGDTVICGPLALPFWRKLEAGVRLVSIAALDDIDPVSNRFETWLLWGLVNAGVPEVEARGLVAKAPTYRHKHYQKYINAEGIAFVMESRSFRIALPGLNELVVKV